MADPLTPQNLGSLPYQTPFLYMDLDVVTQRYETFRRNLPNIDIHYAMKCNPEPRILRHLSAMGSNFEIASYPELAELIGIGVKPADVLFSNPVKIAAHIKAAAEAGLYRFAFDSEEELEKIAREAPGASVYARLATFVAASTVPSEGKFGVEASVCLRLLLQAKKLGLTPYGIAFHVGSLMEQADAWRVAITSSGSLMRELQKSGIQLEMLDLGGGFPAGHTPETPQVDVFAQVITNVLRAELPYMPNKLVIEPGRGLVGDAGVMVSTVIGRAVRGRTTWIHLDVGAFNGFMEALETQNKLSYPLADSRQSPKKATYNLTGPSCDSQDTILFGCQLSADLAVGDKVYIYTAGAYTTSYASRFNGFDIPGIYFAGS